MKQIFFLILFGISVLMGATSEQITQYLSISHSEQQVISIEQVFDSMRQKQEQNGSVESNESTSQVGIVYQEYLEEHLSHNEIEEILALYRTPIMERYVDEIKTLTINDEDINAYLDSLKENPLATEREEIIDEIISKVINEKLQLDFYRSMMQRYVPKIDSNSTQKNDDKNATKATPREKNFVNSMKKSAKNRLLYGTQVFSLEDMEELKKAIGSSIFSKVKRVENEALVKIMNDYIRGVSSKPKRLKEVKKSK